MTITVGRGRARFIYERLADRLAASIRGGTYGPGERLPSLRRVTRQFDVSLATAVEAYRLLESEGLIEARPKSGYFVRSGSGPEPGEPAASTPSLEARPISVAALALALLERARQPDLVRLGAAVPGNELLPLKRISRILTGVVRRETGVLGNYEVPDGNPRLRQAVAGLLGERGCHLPPEEIIVTNGCMEALTLSLRAVARPGDTVALESPCYYGVLQAIESLGLNALELPTDPQSGIDLDVLERVLKERRVQVCVLMPGGNNPLGCVMPLESRRRLAEIAAEHGVPVIEDDIYGDLSFEQPLPPAKAFDSAGEILLCSSFSKTLVPGYRVGYVAPGRYREKLRHLKMLGNVATAGLPQLALAEFLGRGGYRKVVRTAARVYRERTEALRQAVCREFPEGTRVSRPRSGFVLWVELPSRVDGTELYLRALRAGVAVTPGAIFSPVAGYRHHIRLSCGQEEGASAAAAVRVLGNIASALAREDR